MNNRIITQLEELVKAKCGDKIEIKFNQGSSYKNLSGVYQVEYIDNSFIYRNCKYRYRLTFNEITSYIFRGYVKVKYVSCSFANSFGEDIYDKVNELLEEYFPDIEYDYSEVTEMVNIVIEDDCTEYAIAHSLYTSVYDYAEKISDSKKLIINK